MKKFLKLVAKNPFQSFVTLSVAAAVLAATLTAFATIMFAIYVPNAIREQFYDKTGFHVNTENIFVNVLTGSIEIHNAVISSPSEYPDREFMKVASIRMIVNPLDLIKARFHIYKADIKIDELKNVRLSASKFNLRDFFEQLEKRVSFAPEKKFEGMNIEIDSCEYADLTYEYDQLKKKSNEPSDEAKKAPSEKQFKMNRKTQNKVLLGIKKMPLDKETKLLIKESFDKADASFMTTVLKLAE